MNNRQNICINGLWDFCPGDGSLNRMPEKWEEKIVVPSPWNINSFSAPQEFNFQKECVFLRGGDFDLFPQYPKIWERAESGWYKTEFYIPEEWKGNNISLCFNAVLYYSEYYINGHLIAADRDGYLPFEFNIESFIKWGETNELIVGAIKMSQFKITLPSGEKRYEFPTGSFWYEMGGIWQDVFLKVYPATYLSDVFVTADIEVCTIDVKSTLSGLDLENFSLEYVLIDCNTGESVILGNQWDLNGNNVAYAYDYSEVQKNIKLWWPHAPNLYKLEVILKKDGIGIDKKTTRFGFRSFKIQGKKFYLNGIPYNLRNDSWHYMGFAYQTEEYAKLWYKMEKAANVNSIRLHAQPYPEFFLEIADEVGMIIVDESAVWGSHTEYYYSETFIENAKKHVERLVKRDRNHPSVMIWSVENECLPSFLAQGNCGNGAVKSVDEHMERLYSLSEPVLALDTCRLLSFDGGNDLNGRAQVYCMHYPPKKLSFETSKPLTLGEMGNMYYASPDLVCEFMGDQTFNSFEGRLEAIGRDAFELLKYYRKHAAQTCIFNLVWYGLRPLPFKEKIHTYEDYTTPGIKPTKTGRYISTLNAGYDEELPEYITNPIFEWAKKAYIPERFFFEDQKVRFYNGDKGSRRISVHNDSMKEKLYTIYWRVEENGKSIFENATEINVKPSEFELLTVKFDLPDAEAITTSMLNITMQDDDGLVFEDKAELKTYNLKHLLSRVEKVGQIGVVGCKDSEFIEKIKLENIRFIEEEEADKGFDAYIVAGGIDSQTYEFLESTGKSILDISLEGKYFKDLSGHNNVEKAFISADKSILTQDIEEWDLFAWDNYVSISAFSEFIGGNYVPLVTNGIGAPLVVDIYRSGTQLTLSGIDFVGQVKNEPAAAVLFLNLILHMAEQRTSKHNDCVLISTENSRLTKFLKGMHVKYIKVDPEDNLKIKALRNIKVIIADGEYSLEYLCELLPYNAATVFVWNMRIDTVPLSIKKYIHISQQPLYHMEKVGEHKLLEGIQSSYMYGLEVGNEVVLVEAPIAILDNSAASGIIRNTNIDWRVWNNMGENVKTASILRSELENRQELFGLLKCRINGIEVIINQIQYSLTNMKLKRLTSILLTNLGAEMENVDLKHEEDVFDGGIYENGLKKTLLLKTSDVTNPENMLPLLNRDEGVAYWGVANLDEMCFEQKGYTYGFYVSSPSDRTNLLLNPDLVGVSITSGCFKKVFLNNELVAEGEDISIGALPLKAGWNKFILFEDRKSGNNGPINVYFTRKDDLPLDLTFSLESEILSQVPRDTWNIVATHNTEDSRGAVNGKGSLWDSLSFQAEGMYLQIDMQEEYLLKKLQFTSSYKEDHGWVQYGVPKTFVIKVSIDGETWNDVYTVNEEQSLTLLEGRVIIYTKPCTARYIRIMITGEALKSMRISELKVFTVSD